MGPRRTPKRTSRHRAPQPDRGRAIAASTTTGMRMHPRNRRRRRRCPHCRFRARRGGQQRRELQGADGGRAPPAPRGRNRARGRSHQARGPLRRRVVRPPASSSANRQSTMRSRSEPPARRSSLTATSGSDTSLMTRPVSVRRAATHAAPRRPPMGGPPHATQGGRPAPARPASCSPSRCCTTGVSRRSL